MQKGISAVRGLRTAAKASPAFHKLHNILCIIRKRDSENAPPPSPPPLPLLSGNTLFPRAGACKLANNRSAVFCQPHQNGFLAKPPLNRKADKQESLGRRCLCAFCCWKDVLDRRPCFRGRNSKRGNHILKSLHSYKKNLLWVQFIHYPKLRTHATKCCSSPTITRTLLSPWLLFCCCCCSFPRFPYWGPLSMFIHVR